MRMGGTGGRGHRSCPDTYSTGCSSGTRLCLVQSCFCDAPPPAQAFTKAFSERQKQGPYLQETLKGTLEWHGWVCIWRKDHSNGNMIYELNKEGLEAGRPVGVDGSDEGRGVWQTEVRHWGWETCDCWLHSEGWWLTESHVDRWQCH